jgi:hypothetical protein
MELAIPLVALGGLFIVSNQNKKNNENFKNIQQLPNTDIPDKNYPELPPIRSINSDPTSKLSTTYYYDEPSVFTDKYFNTKMNKEMLDKNSSNNATYNSLSGKKVDLSYFQHNNMAPYFGSHVRSIPAANSREGLLDNYTGAGSQVIDKKEQSPLFKPGSDLQWSNGAPNSNDFYQSRVNPSMKISNVKPFEEERVGPGLGLGYTKEGVGGFNSGMMSRELWTEKNVDQLRAANNPKQSYNLVGLEGPSISMIKNRGDIGYVEKNRVDTTYELGQDRLFTTTGIEKGRTLRSEQPDRFVNRPETTTDYTGIAGYSTSGDLVSGEYMPSKHIDLASYPFSVASAVGKGAGTESDYGIKTKKAYPNNRTITTNINKDSYFGVAGGVIGEAVAPLLDILRPSRKENTIGSLRPYQNAHAPVNASYVYDPKDVLPTTMKETTVNSKFHLNVNAQQRGAYEVLPIQGTHTARQDTSDYYYAGNAGADRKMPAVYEGEKNQRNNDIKASTIQGRMVPGNMSLLNSDINMRVKNNDYMITNNRPVVATAISQTPSISNMGRMQGFDNLYSNIQLDRNTSDITSVLQNNPYVIPHFAAQ